MPGQFCTYLQFRGEKYLNTFIVSDANDCTNLLSHGATFRMGVLLPNYPKDMVVEEENVPHFSKMSGDKMMVPNGPLNVFQILGDIQKCQQAVHNQCKNPELASIFRTTTPFRNSTFDSDEQVGKASTCTCTSCAKYFMEWTSSTKCTCPQATTAGSEAWELSSLAESQALPQW